MTNGEFVAAAIKEYRNVDDIEIPIDATVERDDELGGAWVSAKVFIEDPDQQHWG